MLDGYIYILFLQFYNDTEWPVQTMKLIHCVKKKKKSKGFLLQAWSGCWGSRMLRLLDLLDFRHYEGGKVVTLTHRPPLPPGLSWYSFLEADTTGDRSQNLPTSSAVP
jgi:hypothetical protein